MVIMDQLRTRRRRSKSTVMVVGGEEGIGVHIGFDHKSFS